MTEADILELFYMCQERTLTILQWWLSVTLGVIVASYLAGKKLGAFSVGAVLVLYVAFSVNFWMANMANAEQMLGYVQELQMRSQSGQVLSLPAAHLVDDLESDAGLGDIVNVVAGSIAILGAFVATIAYVIGTGVGGRRKR